MHTCEGSPEFGLSDRQTAPTSSGPLVTSLPEVLEDDIAGNQVAISSPGHAHLGHGRLGHGRFGHGRQSRQTDHRPNFQANASHRRGPAGLAL